jgi:putative ABC transport system permease protein
VKVEAGAENPWMTVVGVVGDVRFKSLDSPPTLAVFHPHAQQTWRQMAFAVRTEGPPSSLISAIRREIAAIDREQPVYNMTPLETMLEGSIATPRFHAVLILGFAVLALALAVVGAYGVMSYSVGQRTQEIGIRIALGAKQKDVLRMVLQDGMKLTLAGVIIGSLAALGLTRLMASLLFGVSATDPLTFTVVPIVLVIVALAACYVPARRAMRVDPMVALRYE